MLIARSDVKYTLRQLGKNPGFVLLAVIVLAGGLGLSIFTFTMTYTMAYKPLELTYGDSIVAVCAEGPGRTCLPLKAYEFASFRAGITSLENVGIQSDFRTYIKADNLIYQAEVTRTEWNMFQLSESTALHGRVLQEFDQLPAAEPVAVLSYDFWQLAFDGDASIIDRLIDLDDRMTRVVGVMPEGYKFPRWTDVWIPVSADLLNPVANGMTLIEVHARLAPGSARTEASNELSSLMFRMRQQYPPLDDPENPSLKVIDEADAGFVTPLPTKTFAGTLDRIVLAATNVMSGIIFLLACINVGTLLLARTNERMKDISVRVALGAPRMRLMIQAMSESVVIAMAGAVLAILLAGLGLEALNRFLFTVLFEEGVPFWWKFKMDGSTLLAALLFSIVAVLLTSAIPAWKLINGNFNEMIKDGTRGAVGLRAGRFSRSLVTTAIVLITTFLYIGTVATYSIWSLGQTIKLIDSDGMHSVEIPVAGQFSNLEEQQQFYQSLQFALANHPDVQDVLLLGVAGDQSIAVDGEIYLTEADKPVAPVQMVLGDLSTIGAILLEGRGLALGFDQEAISVMVSRSLAERLWSGRSPIGQTIRVGDPGQKDGDLYRVGGIVSNTPVSGTTLFDQQTDMVYLPLGRADADIITAIIRSPSAPESAALTLRNIVHEINSGLPVNIVHWVEDQQSTTFVMRAGVMLFTGCGLFAFLISVAGIFGLTRNSIILRTQEIGTRRALGASDRIIGMKFTTQGARQVLLGIAIGTVVCFPLAVLIIQSAGIDFLLPGLIASLIMVTSLLLCGVSAIHFPIRRLLQREPAELLRHQ